jgi:hypothetical protein
MSFLVLVRLGDLATRPSLLAAGGGRSSWVFFDDGLIWTGRFFLLLSLDDDDKTTNGQYDSLFVWSGDNDNRQTEASFLSV